jgi:hypothetical protein
MKLIFTSVHGLLRWQMIRKPFMPALVQEGGFGMREKRYLPHLHTFETVPNYDKEREYKYFMVNFVDMPKESEEVPGMIIGHIQLYHCYVISVSEETLWQSSYTSKKALFPCVSDHLPTICSICYIQLYRTQKRSKKIIG